MPSIWFSSPQLFYWQIIIIVNQLWRIVSVCAYYWLGAVNVATWGQTKQFMAQAQSLSDSHSCSF